MTDKNPYAPHFQELPEEIPIFPLEGVLLLPCGQLPLNIFEPRYLAMVDDALSSNRLIGMIQPEQKGPDGESATGVIYNTGCAGKITELNETKDGRYLITLTGICRFDVATELEKKSDYRRVQADWSSYEDDLLEKSCLDVDRDKLIKLLKNYFDHEGMECDWDAVNNAPDGKLITCLSMVCPFEPQEKQALMEAKCCKERAKLFMTMLEMAANASPECKSKH